MSCARATDLAAEYVLGALDDVDADEVRRHLAACGEPHAEFAELGGVVPYLATSLDPIEPAPELRARVLSTIARSMTVPAPSTAVRQARAVEPVPALARSQRRWPWPAPAMLRLGFVAAAAAAIVLAVSLVSLNARLSESQAYADRLAHAAALASAPGARTAALVSGGTGTGVGGLAVLPSGAAGVLVISGLAPTQGSQVYEAWLITGGGAPRPAGSFTVGSSGAGWIDALPASTGGGVTVALTLEPGPGATAPTLPILASGKTGA